MGLTITCDKCGKDVGAEEWRPIGHYYCKKCSKEREKIIKEWLNK